MLFTFLSQRPDCRHGPHRKAFTLVEMAVAVTVMSILFGVAISLLLGLKNWDRNTRLRSLLSEQGARLSESLRNDIRQASDVSMPTDRTLLIASPGEKRTQYELKSEGCHKTITVPSEAQPRVELFAVGPAASWSLERDESGTRPMLVVTVERAATDGKRPAAPLLVQATLGADLPTPSK